MNANPETYLKRFAEIDTITLVGPLASPGVSLDEPVIFVDGGSARREAGIGLAVGDGDSSDTPMDDALDVAKDFSDLAYALRQIDESFSAVMLTGFLGGRRDHELFNFGEVHAFLNQREKTCRVSFDQEVQGFSAGEWSLEVQGLFSLALLAPARVTLSGACEYAIAPDTRVETLSSFGLSNVGSGQITVESDGPFFVLLSEG